MAKTMGNHPLRVTPDDTAGAFKRLDGQKTLRSSPWNQGGVKVKPPVFEKTSVDKMAFLFKVADHRKMDPNWWQQLMEWLMGLFGQSSGPELAPPPSSGEPSSPSQPTAGGPQATGAQLQVNPRAAALQEFMGKHPNELAQLGRLGYTPEKIMAMPPAELNQLIGQYKDSLSGIGIDPNELLGISNMPVTAPVQDATNQLAAEQERAQKQVIDKYTEMNVPVAQDIENAALRQGMDAGRARDVTSGLMRSNTPEDVTDAGRQMISNVVSGAQQRGAGRLSNLDERSTAAAAGLGRTPSGALAGVVNSPVSSVLNVVPVTGAPMAAKAVGELAMSGNPGMAALVAGLSGGQLYALQRGGGVRGLLKANLPWTMGENFVGNALNIRAALNSAPDGLTPMQALMYQRQVVGKANLDQWENGGLWDKADIALDPTGMRLMGAIHQSGQNLERADFQQRMSDYRLRDQYSKAMAAQSSDALKLPKGYLANVPQNPNAIRKAVEDYKAKNPQAFAKVVEPPPVPKPKLPPFSAPDYAGVAPAGPRRFEAPDYAGIAQ